MKNLIFAVLPLLLGTVCFSTTANGQSPMPIPASSCPDQLLWANSTIVAYTSVTCEPANCGTANNTTLFYGSYVATGCNENCTGCKTDAPLLGEEGGGRYEIDPNYKFEFNFDLIKQSTVRMYVVQEESSSDWYKLIRYKRLKTGSYEVYAFLCGEASPPIKYVEGGTGDEGNEYRSVPEAEFVENVKAEITDDGMLEVTFKDGDPLEYNIFAGQNRLTTPQTDR